MPLLRFLASRSATALALSLAVLQAQPLLARQPPDIVLIVADDLGFSDLGSYGGEIRTPHLDGLADDGIRFSNFQVTPRCSPTRAALLTGRWPHEVGVGHLNRDWGLAGYRGRIDPAIPTLAERLRDLGYRTAMVGKWHLAAAPDERTPADPDGPLARGFDSFWGTLRGSGSHYFPATLFDGTRSLDPTALGGRSYSVAMTDQAIVEIEGTARQHPLFLYVSFTDPHWPLQVEPELMAAYRGEYLGAAGPEATRHRRFERLLARGIVPAGTKLPGLQKAAGGRLDRVPGTDPWRARRMQAYAAMVERLDRQVGRILEALRVTNRLDDTLIVFLSDNGASAETFTGLWRVVPFFLPGARRTPDGRSVRSGRGAAEGATDDTFQGYGAAWATTSNTPFVGHKHHTDEGGIAAPLILRAPRLEPSRRGTFDPRPSHVVDLAPTLLAAAGLHDSYTGQRGIDLLAADKAERPPRYLFQEHEGNRAVRKGRWKLVSRWPWPWRLHDLEADRTELIDPSRNHPEVVAELSLAWDRWAKRSGVRAWPLPVPAYRWTLYGLAGLLVFQAFRLLARRTRTQPSAHTRAE